MKNDFIIFDQEKHEYHDIEGNHYTGVSKLISSVSNPFNSDQVSFFVAKKRDKESKLAAIKFGVTQSSILDSYPKFERGITKEQVLQEWKDKADEATKRGNRYHKALEEYDLTRTISNENQDIKNTIIEIHDSFKDYHHSFNEVILHSVQYRIAGTTDKLCWRTGSKPGVVDVYDYKTNEEIQFFSKYGNWLKPPLNYLEDCSFIKYCLQKSVYAVMLEEMTGCSIGRLALIHIPHSGSWKMLPVPYLRDQAIALMRTNTFETIENIPTTTEQIDW